jgi:HSP20 family molecular chaperone IbpA
MNRLFRDSYGPEGREESLTTTSFAPPVDVYEDEHTVSLKIEVPGIDEKDIDVRIENNILTVHGERKFEKEEKEENFRRVERQYGRLPWPRKPKPSRSRSRSTLAAKRRWKAKAPAKPRKLLQIT